MIIQYLELWKLHQFVEHGQIRQFTKTFDSFVKKYPNHIDTIWLFIDDIRYELFWKKAPEIIDSMIQLTDPDLKTLIPKLSLTSQNAFFLFGKYLNSDDICVLFSKEERIGWVKNINQWWHFDFAGSDVFKDFNVHDWKQTALKYNGCIYLCPPKVRCPPDILDVFYLIKKDKVLGILPSINDEKHLSHWLSFFQFAVKYTEPIIFYKSLGYFLDKLDWHHWVNSDGYKKIILTFFPLSFIEQKECLKLSWVDMLKKYGYI